MEKNHAVIKSYLPLLAFTMIALVAVFLRFYKLGEWSFWGDEIFTLGSNKDGFVTSLTTRLIHFTTEILGVNEWSARFVPALIGAVSIPILFVFIKPIFGQEVSLISSAILAVSTWHIYWSQNARFYILLLLFYSLALLSFYLGLEKDKPILILLSLIFIGLAAQERLLALIIMPVIVFYLLGLLTLRFDKPLGLNIRNLTIFFAPGVIGALLFAGPFLGNLSGWFSGFHRINNNPLWLFSGLIYYVGLPIICLAGFGAAYLFLQKKRAGLFFSIAAVFPILAIMVASLFQYSANRYFFVSLTSWIILASLAIYELLRTQAGYGRLLAISILILVISFSLSEDYLYFHYQNGNRENWRGAFEYILERDEAEDLIFLGNSDLGNYYASSTTHSLNELEESFFGQSDHRAWFLIDMTTEEFFPQQLNWIKTNAKLMEIFDVNVRGRVFIMRVYLYDPRFNQTQILLPNHVNSMQFQFL